jgi:hypothetical protein
VESGAFFPFQYLRIDPINLQGRGEKSGFRKICSDGKGVPAIFDYLDDS